MPGHTEIAIGRRRAPPSLHPAEAAQPLTDTDSTRRRRWQTAKSDTKADAKAERAEMLARLHRGERVVRPQVLASADPTRRPLGEALGLRWCDVDFEAGLLRARQQLSRQRTPKHLKTDAARREMVLAPTVTRLLRAASFPLPLGGEGRVRGSRPRAAPTAASLLIAKGLNVVFVSRQLGHASPAITLRVYAHLFEQADHAVTARDALEVSYAAMARSTGV